MLRRITYVIGGTLTACFRAEVEAGLRPCPEFLHFIARTEAQLLAPQASASPWGTRWLADRLARRGLGLAVRVAATAGHAAVVTSGEDIGIPVAMAMLLRRPRTRLLIQVHGHYLGGRKFALLAPLLARMRNVQMLCLSDALRDRLVQQYGFAAARCHSVGYGVDTTFFTPQVPQVRAETSVPLVLAAGLANRDYPTLVEAVRGLPLRLRIAASSPWIDQPATSLPDLPANVEVRPAADYRELRALYAQSRLVVVPMHAAEHACGYAVMAEAMAMGRPVVATRLAAPCDFFEDGRHGSYVPPADVAALRRAIRILLENETLADRQGAAARTSMEQSFSLDAFCDRIEAHLPEGTLRRLGAAMSPPATHPPTRAISA